MISYFQCRPIVLLVEPFFVLVKEYYIIIESILCLLYTADKVSTDFTEKKENSVFSNPCVLELIVDLYTKICF